MEAFVGLVVVAVLVALLVLRARLRLVTVWEGQRGLRYRNGRLTGVVGPGAYRVLRPRNEIRTVDVRERFTAVPGQEVLSADAVTLRLSLVARWQVVDPLAAVTKVDGFEAALYLTLQLALREVVVATPVDELLERRGEIGARVLELASPPLAEIGLGLHSVDLRDVTFPGDLKRVFAQVVQARKEGQAALERARGETAALRGLANAARQVEANPALLQLRLLQELAGSSGNTVVIGMPGTTPLPIPPPART